MVGEFCCFGGEEGGSLAFCRCVVVVVVDMIEKEEKEEEGMNGGSEVSAKPGTSEALFSVWNEV